MSHIQLLSLLTKELATHPPQTFTNFGEVVYSSVALVYHIRTDRVQELEKYAISTKYNERVPFDVLQCLGKQDVSILFMQRAIDPKDFHSGQLSFPGGKVEPGETDYQAAIRETNEEVGLDLLDPNFTTLYLGRNPENVYVRRIKNNKFALHAIAHIFLIVSPNQIPLNISPAEVNQALFIPFETFFRDVKKRTQTQKIAYNAFRPYQYVPLLIRPLLYQRLKMNPMHMVANQYDIGFQGVSLWGLTYYILSQTLAIIVYSTQQQNDILDINSPSVKEIIEGLKLNIAGSLYLDICTGPDDRIGRMIASAFRYKYLRKRMMTANYKNILTMPKL